MHANTLGPEWFQSYSGSNTGWFVTIPALPTPTSPGILGAVALRGQTPDGISEELKERGLEIAAVISNDVFPNTPLPIEEVSLETLRQSVEALLIFPYRLTQLLLPPMKLARRGTFVFITSARYLQPEPGFSEATSVRAGTTAFALALAKEAAPFGIQVNVVAPNYLYSEAYYPRARFIDDPAGRREIASKVPMGRSRRANFQ